MALRAWLNTAHAQMPPKRVSDETPEPATKKGRTPLTREWIFTLNNWTQPKLEEVKALCQSDDVIKYIVGKEVGEQGTPHLQGYLLFEKKVRAIEKYRHWGANWLVCRAGAQHNLVYCSKDGEYITNIKQERPLELITELYPWQKETEDMVLRNADKRKIVWIWDEAGAVGKTLLGKYLDHHHGAFPLPKTAKGCKYMAAVHRSDIYIMDMSRMDGAVGHDFTPYRALEEVKNMWYSEEKYEGEHVLRNPPHLLVFANYQPNYNVLSADRWAVAKIVNLKLEWDPARPKPDDCGAWECTIPMRKDFPVPEGSINTDTTCDDDPCEHDHTDLSNLSDIEAIVAGGMEQLTTGTADE